MKTAPMKTACHRGIPASSDTVPGAHGLEASQLQLGHANIETTQIYAERDRSRMLKIARDCG